MESSSEEQGVSPMWTSAKSVGSLIICFLLPSVVSSGSCFAHPGWSEHRFVVADFPNAFVTCLSVR